MTGLAFEKSVRRFPTYAITEVRDLFRSELVPSVMYAFNAVVQSRGPRGGKIRQSPVYTVVNGSMLRCLRFVWAHAETVAVELHFVAPDFSPDDDDEPLLAPMVGGVVQKPCTDICEVYECEGMHWGQLETLLKTRGLK